jgi:AraC-like DNA-binding protein
MDWDVMALTMAGRPPSRDTARPILEGLHALACELNAGMALGAGTEHALALLESTRMLVRGACAGGHEAAEDEEEELAQGGLAGWQIRTLTRFIDMHLADKLCLATLAEAVRLSPSYLCRACRQSFQCSPMQYVMRRRLIAARRLLKQSTMALSELALSCGFADQAHFTRVFRAATGETPRRWRRLWQVGNLAMPGLA